MKSTVSKTSAGGVTITVVWQAGTIENSLDGYEYGQEAVSYNESITLEKDGEVILRAKGIESLSDSYPNMPANAAGVIRGHNKDRKEIAQPVGQGTYDTVKELLAAAKAEAEGDIEKPEAREETKMVINPRYAHMSHDELKAAERNYDTVNNEGGEGYNPYRDNLWVKA